MIARGVTVSEVVQDVVFERLSTEPAAVMVPLQDLEVVLEILSKE